MPELRCRSKLLAIGIDDEIVEIKCDSRFCGARRGVSVLHRFRLSTGELVETQTFRDLPRGNEMKGVGT